jgi:hypothetical protein
MICIKHIIIILLAVLLFACSDNSSEKDISRSDMGAVQSASADQGSIISIGPSGASARSVITLRINDKSVNHSNIRWYINGVENETSRSIRFTLNTLKKGDIVHATVSDRKEKYSSNHITINNSPPVIRKARLIPAVPTVSSRLTVELSAHDSDDDYIAYTYSWTHNGKFAGEESYLEAEFKRGDTITVEVTPADKEDSGKSILLNGSIFNSLPEVLDGTHQYDGRFYTYQMIASDPDGDALAFTLQDGPDGMTIDPRTGLISWEAGQDSAGIYDITLNVSDNHGGKILVPLTTQLYISE